MAYSSTLNSVTVAADAASMAGADYARKTATATKSVEALTAALAEEKKAHAVIDSLNRARAKEMARNLEDAAFAIITTGKAADSARWAAKQAEDADKAASARAANAAKEDQAAKQAVITTDAILAEATVMARSKAMAKENADKAASAALEAYNAAKGPFEGPLAAVTQSANAAAALEKPMKDARWRVVLATREVTAAEAAIAKSKSSQNQKNLDAAKAKLASMNAAHEAAKGKYDAAMAEAAAAEAAAAEAKKELEVFAAPHRQAAAAAAEAAKEKAAADSALATAQKNAASAKSVAAAKASALVKANSDADATGAAAEAAGQRRATAVKAESDARSTYTELYSKQETYKISVLRTEQQEQSNEEKLYKAALWANVKDANYWTSLVVAAIRHELPRLEKAKDINEWCPAYWSASDHHKEVCWLRILGGLVKTESSFKPETKFYEADMKKYSVGMMALSPPNECRNYDTVELLQNPLLNLACGIGKFAGLIERDGVIYGKTIVTNPRTKKKEEKFLGPSAYWSTMRPPYKRKRFDGSCCFNLGKMNEITAFTKQYRNY